jgi:drug/metabolite transporter (DMT)-like permease
MSLIEPNPYNKKIVSPYVLLSIVIIIWGLNYVVGRLLSHSFPLIPGLERQHISGTLYGFFRYVFGTLTMIFVLLYQKRSRNEIIQEINPIKSLLLLSAFFSGIFVLTAHASNEFISSGTTSIIINLCPILVLIYGLLFLHEKITKLKLIGFLLGLGGGFLFLLISFDSNSLIGLLLAFIAMVSWGAYSIVLHYMGGNDEYIIMTVKHGISTLISLPIIFFLFSENSNNTILVLDLWTIFGFIFGGVIATGLAYILYFNAIESIGAPRASAFLFLIPFVSLLGDISLGELPNIVSLLGGILALIGVFLIKISKK